MKIRSIEDIQADIRFVSNRKENFLSRIFYNKKDRLKELRQEEFNRLDLLLLETDTEYKQLADDSMECLANIKWEMKVISTKPVGKGTPPVSGLKGEMDAGGNLQCTAYWEFGYGRKHNPSHFTGRIDHYGDCFLDAVEAKNDPYGNFEPLFYRVRIGDKGQLFFDKGPPVENRSVLSGGTKIDVLAGSIFTDAAIKKRFLENKKRLTVLLTKHCVSEKSM